jgi:hypothetical protein
MHHIECGVIGTHGVGESVYCYIRRNRPAYPTAREPVEAVTLRASSNWIDFASGGTVIADNDPG